MIANTKTLSTARDFSITYPAKYWPANSAPHTHQMTPPKARPSATHTPDHASASRTPTTCALRWATRSTANMARITPSTAIQAQNGTVTYLSSGPLWGPEVSPTTLGVAPGPNRVGGRIDDPGPGGYSPPTPPG